MVEELKASHFILTFNILLRKVGLPLLPWEILFPIGLEPLATLTCDILSPFIISQFFNHKSNQIKSKQEMFPHCSRNISTSDGELLNYVCSSSRSPG